MSSLHDYTHKAEVKGATDVLLITLDVDELVA